MNIKDFSKSNFSLLPNNLLALQKRSWEKFWKKDLKELFREVSPIKDYTGEKLELHILDFYCGESKYKSGDEARSDNASFEAPLRIKTKLVNLQTGNIKKQDILLGSFPQMTKRGTFIINGVERVAISQLIRSPGVFFTSRLVKGKKVFGAKLIPNRGAWLQFFTHWLGFIGVKINRKRRVPVTCLIRAFGVEGNTQIKKLFEDVDKGEINFIEKTIERDPAKTKQEALIEIYDRLRPGEKVTPEIAQALIAGMFFDSRRYDLADVGRWKIWERLPETAPRDKSEEKISLEDRILKKEDIIAVTREIIRLNNNPLAREDKIDHLSNRRVRTFTELLIENLRMGLMRMERIIRDRMASKDITFLTPSQLVNPRPFIGRVQSFFASSQMSQFMDNENPLAEIEHKRRLAATGPGGLVRERAGFEVRDVQPSHYGRICPIQTPEGNNVGLISHLSIFARVNQLGFINTPYFKVKNGRITNKVEYLTVLEEEKYVIASGVIPSDQSGRILSKEVKARIRGEPGIVGRDEIEFADVSPEQILSLATACTPFLQNNDANRVLMGTNMQRQSLPLIDPEPPLILSGIEEIIAKDSGQQIIAEETGEVIEVDGSHVRIKIASRAQKLAEKEYSLNTFVQTNKNSCFHQRPIVRVGEKIKKGDVLAEGGAIVENKLALGKNLLVAIMSWRGGNYEDALIVSERLLKDDTFTSIRLRSFICKVRETKLGPEEITWDIPNVGEDKLNNLDEEGIVRIGAEVGPNDILVGKVSPQEKEVLTAEERLLRAIFGEKAKQIKDTSLRLKHGEEGKVMGIKVFSRKKGYSLDPDVIKQVEISVAQRRKLMLGDKLANRHGNKGVVAKILPEEDMPFMDDGTPVDIILNPTGVIKRMNLGQVLEAHLGFAAKKLGYRAISPSFSGATPQEIKEELKKAGFPEDGKMILYDGRTGKPFSDKITVGYMYVLKLDHMAEDKMHMRSIGPYSLITQQPLGGKAQFGGQRFGEMEVWALEGYGAAYTLQEMLTIKSDDIMGRAATYRAILEGDKIKTPTIPASFNLLVNELKSLALNVIIKGGKDS